MIESKCCTRCNLNKPISEFYKQRKTRDGLRPERKACNKKDSKKYSRPKRYVPVHEKHCRRCDNTKPDGEFYKNARHKDGLSTYCKLCTDALRPTYNRDEQRNFQYKSTFGITLEDYNRLLESQGGRCAICDTESPGSGVKHFCVDHCHVTGMVRGLLCNRCNRGLGHYDDQPDRLLAAAEYLRKHNDAPH